MWYEPKLLAEVVDEFWLWESPRRERLKSRHMVSDQELLIEAKGSYRGFER